jgi:methionyl-tRNA synthetase
LPPDIFARYQRIIGNDVLMVSGSDTHGTPIMLKAEADGITLRPFIDKYHGLFVQGCLAMGLTFDLYTHTDTANHWDVTQQMFLRHWETGFIYKDVQKQWFDPLSPLSWLIATWRASAPSAAMRCARGDQCDNCGRIYDALELKNPRSKITGTTDLEVRETEHFFLDMAQDERAAARLDRNKDKEHWRPNVINFTRGQLELRELRGRAITRDLDWGITIPIG